MILRRYYNKKRKCLKNKIVIWLQEKKWLQFNFFLVDVICVFVSLTCYGCVYGPHLNNVLVLMWDFMS